MTRTVSPSPEQLSELVERLRKRAEIRRQIPGRKSVMEGAPDRISDLLEEAADALESTQADIATLFDAIAHGDEDHRAWLKEAIAAHFAGQPVPIPRGAGTKEKRIAELEAEIARLTTALEFYRDEWKKAEHPFGSAGTW